MLLLLIFIALGILVPLSLLRVIAISLSIRVILSVRYRFSCVMYLLFTSPIPLSKALEGDQHFSTDFAFNTVSRILRVVYSMIIDDIHV